MQTRSKALIALSVPALLIGTIVLIFTATVIRYVVWDDIYVLTTRYDPNGGAEYKDLRTYENLYPWTEHIAHHRNHIAMQFHYTLGASFVIVGMLLIAWAVDRERLRRRISDKSAHTHFPS